MTQKIKIHFGIATVFLLALLILTSCAKNVKDAKTKIESKKPAILVAWRESDYRDSLVKGLESRYRDIAAIEKVPLRGLRKIESGNYRAIVILDAKMGWTMFNTRVKRFIRRLDPGQREKVVLFMSVADVRKGISIKGVDGITAASQKWNLGGVREKLYGQIDGLLTGE